MCEDQILSLRALKDALWCCMRCGPSVYGRFPIWLAVFAFNGGVGDVHMQEKLGWQPKLSKNFQSSPHCLALLLNLDLLVALAT